MAENITLCECGRKIVYSTKLSRFIHRRLLHPTQMHDAKRRRAIRVKEK